MRIAARSSRWAAAMFALALCGPGGARAQEVARPDRADLERRVRARFAETVRAELGITEEQLGRLGRVQASFQSARQELVRREAALRRRMAPGPARPRSESEARGLLGELVAVREEEARLFRAEMDDLLEVLTPEQVLRFYELRQQLTERVRRLRQPGPGRGSPPGPAGGPPRGR